jgi:hypothetical protein
MEFKSIQHSPIASHWPESDSVRPPAANIIGSHGRALAHVAQVTFSPFMGSDAMSVPVKGVLAQGRQSAPGNADGHSVNAHKTIARCHESLATIRGTVEKWERRNVLVDPAMRKQIATAEQAIMVTMKKAETLLQ